MDEKKRQEYLEKLKVLQESVDYEKAHSDADDLLCEVLKEIGYSDIAEAYEEIFKW